MNYFRLLALGIRWSWLLALGLVIGAAGAYFASSLQGKVYQATSTVLVSQAREGPSLTYNDVLANQQLAKTYTSLVRRRPVLAQAEQNLGLPAGAINGMVQTSLPRETQLIEITAQSDTSRMAADIANEVAKVFSNQMRDAQTTEQTAAAQKLDDQINALQGSIRTANADQTRLNRPVSGLPEPERLSQLNDANTKVDSLQTTLGGLQKQRDQVRGGLIRGANSVSVAEEATPPARPIKPRVLINTVLGAALGLLAAFVIVALFDYLDDTVKTPEDLRMVHGQAPLGVIARFTGRRGRAGATAGLTTSMDASSQANESYRMMRTNIEFPREAGKGRSVLVTSCQRGEGKSTTTANLGLALAATGRRVVLVDADLRNPSLHLMFDSDNAMGLSVLLHVEGSDVESELDLQQVADNLLLLPSGPSPANPAELLASRRFDDVIEQLREHADLVIIDTPPLLEVTDASSMASRVDGTILVTEAYRTRRREVRQAVQTLSQVKAQLWGLVLNKVRVPKNRSPLSQNYGLEPGGRWEGSRSEQSPANP